MQTERSEQRCRRSRRRTVSGMGLMGMHDIFEVGIPPHARIINITDPRDRIGTPYVPCPPEKIAAIVMTDKLDPPQKFPRR